MKVRSEEICLELLQVERNLTNPLRSIYHGENVQFPADIREPLEWDAKSGHARNCVNECESNTTLALPWGIDNFDSAFKLVDKLIVTNWPLDI